MGWQRVANNARDKHSTYYLYLPKKNSLSIEIRILPSRDVNETDNYTDYRSEIRRDFYSRHTAFNTGCSDILKVLITSNPYKCSRIVSTIDVLFYTIKKFKGPQICQISSSQTC
jgi:hypothetical protein